MSRVGKGRPTKHTPGLAAEVCSRIADGESLRSISADATMPSRKVVHAWVREDRDGSFRAQYARARQEQVRATPTRSLSWPTTYTIMPSHEQIARARLRVDVRKWTASRLLPKKYGSRLTEQPPDPADVARRIREALDAIETTDGGVPQDWS